MRGLLQTVSFDPSLQAGNLLVFPNIIIGSRLMVDPVGFETTVRRIFLVLAPANAFCFQQIDDCLMGGVDTAVKIANDTICIASHRSNIVRLRRMSDSFVVAQQDALRCKP